MLPSEIGPPHAVGCGGYDVVIPCFNRARTVEQAVASVLSQVPAPREVILVDDGSTDSTAAVLRSLEARHASIRALLLPRNTGASGARNAGLALARAEWVAFLDSDDVWLDGAAATLLGAGRDADVVVGQFRRVWPCGAAGEPECGWGGGDILSALAITGAVGPSWSIVRRAAAAAVAGFDPSFHNCNDWDFYVRLVAAGARFERIDDVVAFYHVAEANRLSHDSAIGIANARRVRAHPVFDRADHAA
ncbi:glycosyltransferase family 2 protein [Sphingomonas sp. RHCKR7]|uniref:glycosyltransferase family 2 protein n=1 Tax=Sphingomonas folli TaxID=2862497 RepID=UPI001C67C934|nr:glycosyltransferase family A protein [Sphingomonas folli]MBW6527522.1 glycosyltransferase family 2 protein [Sphingomonas folli]